MKSKFEQMANKILNENTMGGKNPTEFEFQTFLFYDRSMQPGGRPGIADWIDEPEELEHILADAQKVEAPHGVNIWEDVDGNIIFRVDTY